MQNSLLLGISVGESFAEYSLLLDSKPLAQKRVYLARENLKQSLTQFLTQHAESAITKAFVCLRVPKKLLDYKLSGAVAHITTEGLENWLHLNTGVEEGLTDKDLVFSVHERILADGTIEVPLNLEDLEAIAAKLQLVQCQKVCLHFLHSHNHPQHLEMAKKFFERKNVEVFVPAKSENKNEVSRWNRNSLNATTAGVFAELKKDVLDTLASKVQASDVHFIDSEGKLFQQEQGEQISSLLSSFTALSLAFKDQKADILYLGLEGFRLISHDAWLQNWESPWGPVELIHKKTRALGIQPTLGIRVNDFGHFDFSDSSEGWEPGPMFLGRGQKMTLLDLWADNAKFSKLQGMEERITAQGIARFKTSLMTLAKRTNDRDIEFSQATKQLQSLAMQRLAMEVFLHRQTDKLIVTGPLASVFGNVFKKDSRTILNTEEYSESQSIALWGSQALAGSK